MIVRLFIAFFLVVISSTVSAQYLGVHGNLWEIQEEDAVGYIKRRVGELQKDGTVNRIQKENTDKIKDAMLNPKPVSGIATATKDSVRYFDPTVVTEKAVTDSRGRILFPAGTRVNPLMYGGLSKRLIFIDARDQAQVKFALAEVEKNPRDAIILVAGSWIEISKKLGSQAYYDQAGAMSRRFRLTKVPSVVSQDGLKLKIEEIVPKGV